MRWFTPSLVRHCIAHEEWWEEKEEAISRYVAVLYRRQVSLYLPLRAELSSVAELRRRLRPRFISHTEFGDVHRPSLSLPLCRNVSKYEALL